MGLDGATAPLVTVLNVPKDNEADEEAVELSRWLGTTAAAAYLGVVPRTLYRMIDEDKIPAYKMGRVIRLKRADLDAYLEANRVRPGELHHLYPERSPEEDNDNQ
jgi:excisionase family DNA binding protein